MLAGGCLLPSCRSVWYRCPLPRTLGFCKVGRKEELQEKRGKWQQIRKNNRAVEYRLFLDTLQGKSRSLAWADREWEADKAQKGGSRQEPIEIWGMTIDKDSWLKSSSRQWTTAFPGPTCLKQIPREKRVKTSTLGTARVATTKRAAKWISCGLVLFSLPYNGTHSAL